jgi:hypothetical protein
MRRPRVLRATDSGAHAPRRPFAPPPPAVPRRWLAAVKVITALIWAVKR